MPGRRQAAMPEIDALATTGRDGVEVLGGRR
jgi:hypothetical protein